MSRYSRITDINFYTHFSGLVSLVGQAAADASRQLRPLAEVRALALKHLGSDLENENTKLRERIGSLEELLGRSREMMEELFCEAFERLDEDGRTTPTLFGEIDEALGSKEVER